MKTTPHHLHISIYLIGILLLSLSLFSQTFLPSITTTNEQTTPQTTLNSPEIQTTTSTYTITQNQPLTLHITLNTPLTLQNTNLSIRILDYSKNVYYHNNKQLNITNQTTHYTTTINLSHLQTSTTPYLIELTQYTDSTTHTTTYPLYIQKTTNPYETPIILLALSILTLTTLIWLTKKGILTIETPPYLHTWIQLRTHKKRPKTYEPNNSVEKRSSTTEPPTNN